MQPGRRGARGRPTVRTRILATILVMVAVGMAAAGVVSYEAQRAFVLMQVDGALRGQFDAARRAAGETGETTARGVLARLLSVTAVPEQGGTVGIVDGRVEYLPPVAETLRPDRLAGFTAAAAKGGGARLGTYRAEGRWVRYLAVPIHVAGDPTSASYVAAIDLNARLRGVDGAAVLYAVVSLAVLVLAAVLGWFVAGRLLAPVRRLRTAAERITLYDLDERIPATGHDDVSRLTSTVNRMLDRIREGITRQRTLLDDVRHDLRAPLTLVRGHLELIDENDPAEVRSVRGIAIAEVDRMTRLVDDLARIAEVGLPTAQLQRVAAADLAADVLDRARGIPGHGWSVPRVADAEVAVDRDRIIEAWLQLAQNAAAYSPAGSDIELLVESDELEVRLEVRDHGPGIMPSERARIFERGERGAASRGHPGTGLGLAIVAAIAAAHGGRAEAQDAVGGGALVALVLPRTETEER